jgi:hypothetical protein
MLILSRSLSIIYLCKRYTTIDAFQVISIVRFFGCNFALNLRKLHGINLISVLFLGIMRWHTSVLSYTDLYETLES